MGVVVDGDDTVPALISKVVALVMLRIVRPAGMPVPTTDMPTRKAVVSGTVTVASEALIVLVSVKVSSVITVFVACPLPARGDSLKATFPTYLMVLLSLTSSMKISSPGRRLIPTVLACGISVAVAGAKERVVAPTAPAAVNVHCSPPTDGLKVITLNSAIYALAGSVSEYTARPAFFNRIVLPFMLVVEKLVGPAQTN